uniref:Phytanoyl-CoA dioxygenase n=1 Tax=Globisporangium ultimum (strain ATCC 200006 / CBS 805.95 / DAOM BR144) TaxID=431595 RepID=K3WJG0_GLOUD
MNNGKRAHADDEVNGDDDCGWERPWKRLVTAANTAPQLSAGAPCPPATSSLERERIAFFATHGFVVLPELLADEELRFLQQECALLYEQVHPVKEDAVAQVVEQGCVLDVMADYPLREDAAARVDASVYLRVRFKQFGRLCGGEQHAALLTDENYSVLEKLLFERLPSFAAQLMTKSSDAEEDSTPGSQGLLFFNEHYVVKPPQTAVEFRWHRDDDEQLGMCVHRASIPPYISAWCALDDVTLENGPLRFVSQSSLAVQSNPENGERDANESEDALDTMATAPILVPAGAVVFFLSNVWHCSSANESQATRRAFYAQYSQSKIIASPANPWPLSFAIPSKQA